MCGVCGIVSRRGLQIPADAEARVGRMLGALQHRGPDASAARQAGEAVLGATRLAIRGLDSGRQPLVDEASGVVAVCSGEIDNHRELRRWLQGRGRSVPQSTDVAVVPILYAELGDEFVERLDGAFSLAVFDPARHRLLLARDRAGERPLFYAASGEEIVFTTEIASLAGDLRGSPGFDREAIRGYLRYGSFAAPATPFAAIRKVAPGQVISFEGDAIRRRRYWRWNIVETSKTTPREEDFDGVFRAAVRRQADVDVDFGVFLSGGLDSSLIAAVARRLFPEATLPAYTIRFDEPSYDEGRFAGRAAELLGLEPVHVPVAASDFPDEIARLVRQAGEPLADPAWVPTALLARRAARDVKLVLVGEGGDEMFGGYPTYLGASLAGRYARLSAPLRRRITAVMRRLQPSDRKVTLGFLLKRFVEGAELGGMDRHRLWTSAIGPSILARLGIEDVDSIQRAGGGAEEPGEILDVLQRYDLEHSLAEGLLTKADRATMSWALETRAPFLDRGVMEFAARIPVRDRVAGFQTKVFLKRYAQRYLPRSLARRRKRGLSVPLSGWLRGPLRQWARDRLGDERLVGAGIRPAAALGLLDEHAAGAVDHARALWTLIVLAEWLAWAGGG